MKKIEIITKRLLLTPLGIKYLQTTNDYSSDHENTKYMFYLPRSEEETASFLKTVDLEWTKENPEFYEFAILYNNEKLGMVRTGEWGGRRNKSALSDSFEYRYELIINT